MPLKPESFFDATADAGNITLLLDSEGTILEVSENVESVLGYSSDNLLNKSPFSNDDSSLALIPSPFRAKYKEDLALISQSTNESNQYQEQYQGNHPNEVTLLTKEGDKVRMMIQKIIQLNDNQVEFVFRPDLRFTKILKKAVEIFKGLRQRLEDSKKGMAAKTSFWANTIHELRTPMIAIEGFVDLLLKNEKKTSLDSKLTSEEILKYLKIIKTAGTSSKILINDQLDLAKIESGKVELVLTNFDIKECVQEVSQIALNNKTGVTISSNCELDNSIIKGDKQRIGQILTNLLSNAVKFTEEGKITVNISHNANTNLLEIAVTDPGIGIPKNRLTAIFEPFTQASSSTTQQYGGTGLGLPISKELAKLMKGNLTVKSDEGSGSTFTFMFPLEVGTNESQAPSVENKIETLKGVKILVADDDPANQVLAKIALKRADATVTVVKDGKEALENLREGEFDVLITDVNMPIMNGLEATRAIRAGEAGPDNKNIPIVGCSASTVSSIKKECLEAGMNAQITKPINLDVIVPLIKKHIKNRNNEPSKEAS